MQLRRGALGALVVLATACIEPSTVPCGDVLCPADRVCTEGGCATPEAATACEGKASGESCELGPVAAVCAGGACREVICGDGEVLGPEACDDGNTRPGDGCSATCDSVEVCGNGVVDAVLDEQCDDTDVPGLSNDGCASSCTVEVAGWRDVSPRAISVRGGHAMAYDLSRNVAVLFGGYTKTDLLGDTWVWAGGAWFQRRPLDAPAPRSKHALVFDEVRKVVVLFGGTGANGELGDTWTWDGTNWHEQHPATSPPARTNHTMAYDPIRDRVVLVGGSAGTASLSDTWEWDGSTWRQRDDVGSPGPIAHHAMAWDIGRKVMVLYGGNDARKTWEYAGAQWVSKDLIPPDTVSHAVMSSLPGSGVLLFGGFVGADRSNDTWIYNGATWTKSNNGALPPIRSDDALAYLPTKSQILLFSGYDLASSANLVGDTWSWTLANGWQSLLAVSVSPSPRVAAGMAYDPLRGRALLFGGNDGGATTYFNDLSEWDDRGWTALGTGARPPRRADMAMAFDIERRLLVVFGGRDSLGKRSDTWEWNGAVWTPVGQTSPATPSARDRIAAAYDPIRKVTLVFGGRSVSNNTPLADTWSWDGTAWTPLAPATSPPAREGARMAWDPLRQRVVMFGGRAGAVSALGDTWLWDGTTWTPGPTEMAAARSEHGMAYDAHLQRVVIYGGADIGVRGDTWAFDGTTWTALAAQTTVPLRTGQAMTYDAVQRSIVAFGGLSFSLDLLGDTVAYQLASPFERGERCVLDDDDIDADGRAGCDDPDCWGRCAPLCPPRAACAPDAPQCGDGVCGDVEDDVICPGDCP